MIPGSLFSGEFTLGRHIPTGLIGKVFINVGRSRAPAVGILFRNLLRRATIDEREIICGTGQQFARSRAG
jgi:hypothetical protein